MKWMMGWSLAVVLCLGCSGGTTPKSDGDKSGGAKGDTAKVLTADVDAAKVDEAKVDTAKKTADPPTPDPEPPTPEPPEPETSAAPPPARLGSPELTAGVPGEGEVATVEQIAAMLDTPGVHEVLAVELPEGVGWGTIIGLEENPMTRAKIELGRQLYFDGRLSADGTISCASCHHPDRGYAFGTQFGVGINGQLGGRNSPVAYNRIFSGPQFWDGRAASLEAQAVGPIANPIEMGNTHEAAVKTVADIPGYKLQFERIFEDGVTIDNIGRAIATFERALVTGPSPYDYYEPLRAFEKQFADELKDLDAFKEDEPRLYERYVSIKAASDAHPMSESARRGRELFFGKAKCTACHAGANFSDEKYHNLGIGMDKEEPDWGRYVVTNKEEDKGAFKTPTCRNVVHSAPYMHDGSLQTLLQVVQWYNKGGHPNPHLSDKITKLDLSDQEELDLVAFMEALTGEFPQVEQGRLPQ